MKNGKGKRELARETDKIKQGERKQRKEQGRAGINYLVSSDDIIGPMTNTLSSRAIIKTAAVVRIMYLQG